MSGQENNQKQGQSQAKTQRVRKPPALGGSITRGLSAFRGEKAARLVPHSRLKGPMPWVMIIMVTLTVMATAGGLALNNIVNSARHELAAGATVQILAVAEPQRSNDKTAALRILETDPGVVSVREVSEAEVDELLAPWLGDGVGGEAVPVPALIDVRFAPEVMAAEGGRERMNDIRILLANEAPSARLDAQSSWLGPVLGAMESLQWMAFALALLLAATTAASVWLAARSALGSNQETIEIIHLLGGTDLQVARIFERAVGFDAALGGMIGLLLGLTAILFLGDKFAALNSGMMSGGSLGWLDYIIIAFIPFLAVGLAMLTARITVLTALRRLL